MEENRGSWNTVFAMKNRFRDRLLQVVIDAFNSFV
jgi:hypothetical protein